MLHLPTVTLLSIDTHRPQLTVRMMRQSMQLVKFAGAILLTDTVKHNAILARHNLTGITLVHHTQSDLKVQAFQGGPFVPVDYELACLREPAEHCKSGHILFQEWDSCVMNPAAWTIEFCGYDYGGAPWVEHTDPGWPPCTEANSVGNGGFSLWSAKLCKLTREASEVFQSDRGRLVHDSWMCRTMRPWLEERGVRFMPEQLAERFSCENRIYSGQFGAHGHGTFEMNGWFGRFGHIRP